MINNRHKSNVVPCNDTLSRVSEFVHGATKPNTDYFIPSVDYPVQMVKLIVALKEQGIVSKDTYVQSIHPLLVQTMKSPLCWEICAEFWCNFWKDDDSVVTALAFALIEWDK
jgi:hypothetical protein